MNKQNRTGQFTSYDFLWLSLALCFLCALSLLLSIQPHDYWFYVRIGKDILQTGSIPRVDTISFSRAGRPIYYQPWLSAVIFWLAYKTGGAILTFLLRSLSIGLAYGLIWLMTRAAGAGPRLTTVLVIVLGLSSGNNWSMRPQILVYPLFVLIFWNLWRWQQNKDRSVWLLAVSSFLWANLHGSFILLFLLGGAALLFGKGDRKKLVVWLVVALITSLINPRGVEVWRYVFDLLRSPSDQLYSVEWLPPVNQGWQMNIFFAWLLVFIPLVTFSSHRFSLLEWIWFLGFGWLAFSGVRYVIWFMFILTVYTAAILAEWDQRVLDQPVETSAPAVNILLGGVFILIPVILLPGVREAWWQKAPPVYALNTTPIAATEWLAAHPELPGPLFGDYAFSGYLSFMLPSRPPWIDSRFNAFPPEQWEEYQTITSAAPDWQTLLDHENINLLMLSVEGQPRLLQAVQISTVWCEQYRDSYAVILSRWTSGISCYR